MMQDTLESAVDEEDLDEEADQEVEKVLFEITDGISFTFYILGLMGMAGSVGPELEVKKESTEKDSTMENRLKALKAV